MEIRTLETPELFRRDAAMAWIGEHGLKTGKPICARKYRDLLEDGLPLIEVGGVLFFSPSLWYEWLQAKAAQALTKATKAPIPVRRGRGRPRKVPPTGNLQRVR